MKKNKRSSACFKVHFCSVLINNLKRTFFSLSLIISVSVGGLTHFSLTASAATPANWLANRIDSFRASCVYTFGLFRNKTLEEEQEAYRYAARFFLEAKAKWSAPESRANLTEREARAFLESLLDRQEDFKDGIRVNQHNLFRHHDSKTNVDFYIKQFFSRTELTETGSITLRNYVRFEAMAFALDRFIGGNMVPPSFLLAREKVAILGIPKTGAAEYPKIKRNLALFRQVAYVDTLDAIFANNADRSLGSNILVDADGNLIAHDFDWSGPLTGMIPWAASKRLGLQKVPVKSANGKMKFLDIPLLVEPKIFEQMEKLTPALFVELGKAVGVTVSPEEANIVTGNTLLLASIMRERWVKAFGSVSPPDKSGD